MRAVVLLSGGLDSTVVLAMALEQGIECMALSFDYGQHHKIELESAKAVASRYSVPHQIITIDPSAFGRSALISGEGISKDRAEAQIKSSGTPSTYVPARNTIFLSFALAHAEIWNADEIHIGPNAMDTVYPDCSAGFIEAFQLVMNVATKQGADGHPPKLVAPLLQMNKSDIVRQGKRLNAPIDLTFSCYDPIKGSKPCQRCDACILREINFSVVNSKQPLSSFPAVLD